jgi:hypothetical protein
MEPANEQSGEQKRATSGMLDSYLGPPANSPRDDERKAPISNSSNLTSNLDTRDRSVTAAAINRESDLSAKLLLLCISRRVSFSDLACCETRLNVHAIISIPRP